MTFALSFCGIDESPSEVGAESVVLSTVFTKNRLKKVLQLFLHFLLNSLNNYEITGTCKFFLEKKGLTASEEFFIRCYIFSKKTTKISFDFLSSRETSQEPKSQQKCT